MMPAVFLLSSNQTNVLWFIALSFLFFLLGWAVTAAARMFRSLRRGPEEGSMPEADAHPGDSGERGFPPGSPDAFAVLVRRA
ncbi:MAG: hypothetical protein WB626_03595 [Bacteroidota bacterium]